MSSIWLVCASAGSYARARAEVEVRCSEARLMRFSDGAGVAAAANVLRETASGIAIALEDVSASVNLVRELVELSWRKPILVLTGEPLGESAARLFDAGVTEVIAAESAVPVLGKREACTQGGPIASTSPAPSDANHEVLPDASAALETLDDLPEWEEERYACRSDLPPWDVPADTVDGSYLVRRALESQVKEVVSDEGKEDVVAQDDLVAGSATADKKSADNEALGGNSVPVVAALTSGSAECVSVSSGAARDASRAPLVAVISGRGGVGKTTLVAAMAHAAASMGLRAAVLDLDLMFGNLYDIMGASELRDLGLLNSASAGDELPLAVEKSAMRIAPGVTLWGPSLLPEHAELLSASLEKLIDLLGHEADVIFADTSVFWGDAVASAVSRCDRCLVVGQEGSASSAVRAVELAGRIGVAKTKMTSVFNRFGAPSNQEEQAMRFEMAMSLHSRARVADGGDALRQMAAFGRMGEFMASESAFAHDVEELTGGMLKELGCDVAEWERMREARSEQNRAHKRVHLPWKRTQGALK